MANAYSMLVIGLTLSLPLIGMHFRQRPGTVHSTFPAGETELSVVGGVREEVGR